MQKVLYQVLNLLRIYIKKFYTRQEKQNQMKFGQKKFLTLPKINQKSQISSSIILQQIKHLFHFVEIL